MDGYYHMTDAAQLGGDDENGEDDESGEQWLVTRMDWKVFWQHLEVNYLA